MVEVIGFLAEYSSAWLLVLLGCTATAYILKLSFAIELHPDEPPLLAPKIPLIGHILGMFWYQNDYFKVLENKTHPPAYTMPVLNEKIYVLTSPELIQSAYRNRDLSFEEFFFGSMGLLANISEKCQSLLTGPALREPYVHTFTASLSRDHLHTMNVSALKVGAGELNRFPDKSIQVDSFLLWLRELMTLATTTALFGSKNPFINNPSLAAGFWTYEENSNVFNSSVPKFMIRKELKGRDAIIKELINYFTNGYDSQPDVSPLVQSHAKLLREQGLSNEDVAKLHFATIYAALSNTFPTFFFTIMHIFSEPNLVEKLRVEAKSLIQQKGDEVTVDIAEIENKCPLLASLYRESFRLHAGSSIVRKPLADTIVSDGEHTYVLKKGKVVMLRVPAMHRASELWGPAIESFDSERFLKPETERARKKAFSPFGGGKHLCPGRNFASAEIMGVALAMALGFEVANVKGGRMRFPDLKATQLTHIFGRPKKGEDLRAQISKRKGWENVRWKFV